MDGSVARLKRKGRVEAPVKKESQDDSGDGKVESSTDGDDEREQSDADSSYINDAVVDSGFQENNGSGVTADEDDEEEDEEEVEEFDYREEEEELDYRSCYISSRELESDESWDRSVCRLRREEDQLWLREAIRNAQESDGERHAEVREAYSALETAVKAGEQVPIGPVSDEGGIWYLFCAEYHWHYFDQAHLTKRIHFGNMFDGIPGYPRCGSGQIAAELHIDPAGHCDFLPFDKPAYASLEPITLKSMRGDEAQVIFLGNGFLKLKIDLDVLQTRKRRRGAATKLVLDPNLLLIRGGRRSLIKSKKLPFAKRPNVIEFVGLWTSLEQVKRASELARSQRELPNNSIAAWMNNSWSESSE